MGTHSDPLPAGSQAAAALAVSENPLYVSFALGRERCTHMMCLQNPGPAASMTIVS